jgi:hypothetical protein
VVRGYIVEFQHPMQRTFRRWPCVMLRRLAQRREKRHGGLKFHNIACLRYRHADACLRRLKYSLLRWTTHVPFVLYVKYSTPASPHQQRPAFAALSIPFSDVQPMYLLYLCKIQVNGRTPSTTACLRRLKYSLLRCTTHVPFCTCAKYKSTAVRSITHGHRRKVR